MYIAPKEGRKIPFEQINRTENNTIKLIRQRGNITPHTDITLQNQVDQSSMQESWEEVGDVWLNPLLDENGDINRELITDPNLMDVIGDVTGQDVLDAGCGNGYLTRRLARRGAHMTGVDSSIRSSSTASEGRRRNHSDADSSKETSQTTTPSPTGTLTWSSPISSLWMSRSTERQSKRYQEFSEGRKIRLE